MFKQEPNLGSVDGFNLQTCSWNDIWTPCSTLYLEKNQLKQINDWTGCSKSFWLNCRDVRRSKDRPKYRLKLISIAYELSLACCHCGLEKQLAVMVMWDDQHKTSYSLTGQIVYRPTVFKKYFKNARSLLVSYCGGDLFFIIQHREEYILCMPST